MKVNNTPRARTLQRNAGIKASSIIAACAGWVMLCAVSLATHTQRHTACGVCVTAFAMWLRSQRSAACVSASHPRSSTFFCRRHEQRSEFGRYSLAAVCHPPACVCASHGFVAVCLYHAFIGGLKCSTPKICSGIFLNFQVFLKIARISSVLLLKQINFLWQVLNFPQSLRMLVVA